MKKLKEYITEAQDKKVAIGHFNISDIVGFWAIVNASKKLNLPVIIGVSEGERDFVGVEQVKKLVQSVQDEDLPIYLNADHTYSLERAREVIDKNYDSVIIDAAEKSFEENLIITKQAVEYRDSKNSEALVEGELGFIGKSSKLLEEVIENTEFSEEMMTRADEAMDFVTKTGIDLFAPAVGNIHGMVKSGHNPKINIDKISEIKQAVKIPLVLHGGSGVSDPEFRSAIEAGISIIHINTEIRVAYKKALQKFLSENPDEIAPYKFLKPALQEMQLVIEKRLLLFNNL